MFQRCVETTLECMFSYKTRPSIPPVSAEFRQIHFAVRERLRWLSEFHGTFGTARGWLSLYVSITPIVMHGIYIYINMNSCIKTSPTWVFGVPSTVFFSPGPSTICPPVCWSQATGLHLEKGRLPWRATCF